MWSLLPLSWRIGIAAFGVVALLGGAGGFVLKIKHDAYQQGYDKAQAQCALEKRLQEKANQKAIDEAAKKLDELEKKLDLKELQIDDYLKAIDLAADAAPDASDQCLGPDSVRRLNRAVE